MLPCSDHEKTDRFCFLFYEQILGRCAGALFRLNKEGKKQIVTKTRPPSRVFLFIWVYWYTGLLEHNTPINQRNYGSSRERL